MKGYAEIDIQDQIDEGVIIVDGFGGQWLNVCHDCGGTLEVVRPGKVQCSDGCNG